MPVRMTLHSLHMYLLYSSVFVRRLCTHQSVTWGSSFGSSVDTGVLLVDSILRLTACASCSCPGINVKIPLECSYSNVTKIPPQYWHQNSIQTHNFFPSAALATPNTSLHIILPSSFPRALPYLLPLLLLLLLLLPVHPLFFLLLFISFFL